MATNLPMPVELTDAELDAVAAGQIGQVALGTLVNVQAALNDIQVTVNDVLSHNDVDIRIGAISVLSGLTVGVA